MATDGHGWPLIAMATQEGRFPAVDPASLGPIYPVVGRTTRRLSVLIRDNPWPFCSELVNY